MASQLLIFYAGNGLNSIIRQRVISLFLKSQEAIGDKLPLFDHEDNSEDIGSKMLF
ncbi:Uncharacterised protein [Yersinia intermedia]|uniref:Uncharacterized protein n=1 Tax=Yersinia intermedia TaxID=631 RepID=A0A0H5LSC3_YERIN|nr:Uncharacterised protein [Yersinia intermedia]